MTDNNEQLQGQMTIFDAIGYADTLDRIRSEVAAYPAPSIPKREVLNIIREVTP